MFWSGEVFKVFKKAEIYIYLNTNRKNPKGYSIVKASSLSG